MSLTIPLTRGYVAIVDREDYERLSKFNWQALVRKRGTIYATRAEYGNGAKRMIYMHREIVGAQRGVEIDHIDGNGLNNTRANLRLATRSQNSCNARYSSQSGVRGVHKIVSIRYQASVGVNRKHYYLGTWGTVDDACRAYDAAAVALQGEFAITHFYSGPKSGFTRDQLIVMMHDAGIRYGAIGAIYGFSRQRAEQIYNRATSRKQPT